MVIETLTITKLYQTVNFEDVMIQNRLNYLVDVPCDIVKNNFDVEFMHF